MNNFELDYIKFEQIPQINQLTTIFYFTTEEVIKILETADVDIKNPITWLTLSPTETLAINFTTRMDQNNVNTSIKVQVNSINPYTIKYQGTHKLHT